MGAEYIKDTFIITGTIIGVGTALYNPLSGKGYFVRSKKASLMGKAIYFTNVVLIRVPKTGPLPVVTLGLLKESDYAALNEGQQVTVEARIETTFKNGGLLTNVKAVSFEVINQQ